MGMRAAPIRFRAPPSCQLPWHLVDRGDTIAQVLSEGDIGAQDKTHSEAADADHRSTSSVYARGLGEIRAGDRPRDASGRDDIAVARCIRCQVGIPWRPFSIESGWQYRMRATSIVAIVMSVTACIPQPVGRRRRARGLGPAMQRCATTSAIELSPRVGRGWRRRRVRLAVGGRRGRLERQGNLRSPAASCL